MRFSQRGFTALVAAALIAWPFLIPPILAQSGSVCPGINAVAPIGDGATITVSSTAVGFPAADIATATRKASVAVGYVGTAAIRYWDNGTDPTAAVGLPIDSGERFVVCGVDAIIKFRMIRQTVDASVTTAFYGAE